MYNGYSGNYQQPPPPNLLNEGPISLRQISKNGTKIFDMLKGIHNELKFMDNNHVKMDPKEGDWSPISDKTNIIGKRIEERLNSGIDVEDLYYTDNQTITGNAMQNPTSIENYHMRNENHKHQNTTIIENKNLNNQLDYKRTNIEKEKTMSRSDDDITEFLGGATIGDSFDKTIFVNMDKTNKSILSNTTKICKLLGLLIQLENKNGARLEQIAEKLNNHSRDSYEETYENEMDDSELNEND